MASQPLSKAPSVAMKELVSGERPFLTCAGSETFLVYQQGMELPEFASFAIYHQPDELEQFEANYLHHIFKIAAESGHGLLVDIQTWRASPAYLKLLGREGELEAIHRTAVAWTRGAVERWRQKHGHTEESFPVVIVADVGPRGDGYKIEDDELTADEFHRYHSHQLNSISAVGGVDLVCAWTITSVEESIGIAKACDDVGLPVIISATVETDGRLPDGSELKHLVEKTDAALEGRRAPLYFFANCVHPSHIGPTLEKAAANEETWMERFRGIRANASCKSHEELDNSTELDRGDVEDWAMRLKKLKEKYDLRVVGGCCGTDHEHIAAVAR